MKRKYMVISGFVFLVLVLSISCENNEVVGPVEKESTIFSNKEIMNLEVKNIGKIHNEILEEFDKKHDLLSDERLKPEEFITITMKSINKIFQQRDIPCEVSRNDIRFIISKFVEIKQAGVYNFFSDSEQDLSNVKPLFTYLEKNMGLNPNTAERCMKFMDMAEKEDPSRMLLQNEAHNKIDNENTQYFSEIFVYSRDFWEVKNRSIELVCQEEDYVKKSIDGMFFADAAGGIIGALFGCGIASTIMAPAASLAFQCQMDHPEYWLPPTHIGRW